MQPKETKPFLGPSKGERLRRAQRMMSFSVLLRFMDGARWWMAMMRRVWRSGRGRSNCFPVIVRSEEHTSELQSLRHLVCRLLLAKKQQKHNLHVSELRRSPRRPAAGVDPLT